MQKALRAISFSKQLAFTALFAALCCVGTVVIAIPLPNGYFNVGDVFVLLSAWCLGPLYGSLAAGLGSALADIISGFAIYAPATLFIKALDGFVAYMVYSFLKKFLKNDGIDFVARILSALAGELCMTLGYFLFECALYGVGAAAVSVPGNSLQGLLCLIGGTAIVSILYHVKTFAEFFPALKK